MRMRKILTAVLVMALFMACPGFSSCGAGTDPYATARIVINGAQIAVGASETVFMAWAAVQTDPAKVKDALVKFTKIKSAVLQGLQVALDGVDIATTAKTVPDTKKLMAQAETAFQDLRRMLETLLVGSSTMPTPKDLKIKIPVNDLQKMFENLPKTLLK
jgi:hypothetical protein